MKHPILSAITALLMLASTQASHAALEPGHWEASSNGELIRFSLYQEPTDADVTYLYVNVATTVISPSVAKRTLTGYSFTLDSAADLYIVHPGDALSNTLLEAGTYPALIGATNGPWQPYAVHDNDDFWIGARIRHGNVGAEPWTGLGWAHLRFEDDGSLTLLGSAMAYDAASLRVGAVPEPGSLGLLGSGLAALGLAAARRKRLGD